MSITLLTGRTIALCLLVCAAGCGESIQATQMSQAPETSQTEVPVTTTNDNPTTSLSGGMYYASDVESIPNEPHSAGWVATMTPTALDELIADRALTVHVTHRSLQIQVLPEDFQRFTASTAISATGQYALTTPAGEQFVCFSANGVTAGHGVMLGCAKLTLLGGEQRVQLFSGENGFFVEQETL